MKKIISFFKDGHAEEMLGRIALCIVIVPVILNVLANTFLNYRSNFLEQMALIAFVWVGYAGFGYLYKMNLHVGVDFIVNNMPAPLRKVTELFRDVYLFVFSLVMLYWGFVLSKNGMVRTLSGTNILYIYADAALIVGFFCGAVHTGSAIIRRFMKKNKKEEMSE